MELNLLKYLFISFTIFIVFLGGLVNWFEKYLPTLIPQVFRYGKFAYDGKPSKFKVVTVPKSWFKHFYVFSSLYSLYALYLAIDVYMYGAKPSPYLIQYLDFFCGSTRKTDTRSTAVLITLTLFTLQSIKRFYETWFVSVFSDAKINISHYIVGFLHYWGAITVVLSQASGFDKSEKYTIPEEPSVTVLEFHGTLLFLYNWIMQYKCAIILAKLRKNSSGDVVTTQHKIPQGGLFHYVSSPHLMCEVFMYASIVIILDSSYNFLFVFLWVLSNQVEAALLNHWWYKKTFVNYPKERKAIFPGIL